MDIRCPICSEPWDLDSLHEEVTERFGYWDPSATPRYNRHSGRKGATVLPTDRSYEDMFNEVRKDFSRHGCAAFGERHNGQVANPIVAEVLDLLGDDIDGAASLFEDAEFLGVDL